MAGPSDKVNEENKKSPCRATLLDRGCHSPGDSKKLLQPLNSILLYIGEKLRQPQINRINRPVVKAYLKELFKERVVSGNCQQSVVPSGDEGYSRYNGTELKQAERALRQSQHTLLATLESTADGILVVDESGRIAHLNRRFMQIWGFPAELVEPRDDTRLLEAATAKVVDPIGFMQRIREIYETAEPQNDTIHLKDGRVLDRRSCPLLIDGRIAGRVWSFRDVTTERQAERLAAIGELMAGLAHENRNVLQRIQACLEMLELEVQDRPEALNLVARMQAAQDRLHHLYEEVHEYAAPIVLNREDIAIKQIVVDAWRHFELELNGRIACLRCSIESVASRVDRSAMECVFRNLFENSAAACDGSLEVDVSCRPGEIQGRPAWDVVVRDNGPGLTAEQRTRVFEPFYTTKTKGIGLGMAICRRLVEAHGGLIMVGERTGPGAEIVISIPTNM